MRDPQEYGNSATRAYTPSPKAIANQVMPRPIFGQLATFVQADSGDSATDYDGDLVFTSPEPAPSRNVPTHGEAASGKRTANLMPCSNDRPLANSLPAAFDKDQRITRKPGDSVAGDTREEQLSHSRLDQLFARWDKGAEAFWASYQERCEIVYEIQKETAKPGCKGSFSAALRRIRLSDSTAYDMIKRHRIRIGEIPDSDTTDVSDEAEENSRTAAGLGAEEWDDLPEPGQEIAPQQLDSSPRNIQGQTTDLPGTGKSGPSATKQKPAQAQPGAKVVAPNINVTAVELTRDLESASRKQKLATVIDSRNRLNPSVTKNLIAALTNTSNELAAAAEQLSADLPVFSGNVCHQKQVREAAARLPEPDLPEKLEAAATLKNAYVREISFNEAKGLILANEYLGSMGTSKHQVGLFFKHPKTKKEFLGGTAVFGHTAGTNASNVCGPKHKHEVLTLIRGACCPWADHEVESNGKTHSGAAASFLISHACDLLTAKGFHIFIGYSDPRANEIGTVYQAANWIYTGMTSATEKYRTPDGREHDCRQISGLTRDRRNGGLAYKRTRRQQKEILLKQGCTFFKGDAKHRYVYFAGNKWKKLELTAALRLQQLPYPKRQRQDKAA